MANDGKKSHKEAVFKDVQSDSGDTTSRFAALTIEQLKATAESAVQNVTAIRGAYNLIERLTVQNGAAVELLQDCRVVVDAHGHKALTRRIDKWIKDIH